MNRRAYTLWELSAGVAIGVMLLGVGSRAVTVLLRAQRDPGPPAALADLACDRLRQDLGRGALEDAGALRAGGHRWAVAGAAVTRDGLPQAGLRALRWERDGCAWRVVAMPVRGPERVLRVEDRR